MNESLLYTFLDPELQDLFVACRSVALDILASWLDAELPRTFDPSIFLKAVI